MRGAATRARRTERTRLVSHTRRAASDAIPRLRLRTFRRDPLFVLKEQLALQGDVACLRFGRNRLFVLNHPDDIEHVLVTNPRNYVRTMVHKNRDVSEVAEGHDADGWEIDLQSRRVIQPAFSRGRLAAYLPWFLETARRDAARWSDGEVVNVFDAAALTVVELTMTAAFGRPLDLPVQDVLRNSRTCFRAVMPASSRAYDLTRGLRIGWAADFVEAYEALTGTLGRGLAERAEAHEPGDDALSLLVAAQAQFGWSEHGLVRRATAILLTVGNLPGPVAAWALYLLARHRDVLERLRAELSMARLDDERSFRDLPYLRAVIYEVLRLHPPSWRLSRQAVGPDVIGGRAVMPGDYIWVTSHLVHRDPRWWPEPDRFLPERWLDHGALETRPRLSYFPFGAGGRKCLADFLSFSAIATIVGAVTERWHLTVAEGASVAVDPQRPARPIGDWLPLRVRSAR
jgi:cytochrome P450